MRVQATETDDLLGQAVVRVVVDRGSFEVAQGGEIGADRNLRRLAQIWLAAERRLDKIDERLKSVVPIAVPIVLRLPAPLLDRLQELPLHSDNLTRFGNKWLPNPLCDVEHALG